jgi:ParB-like chromosome segregation protein Spo0J
MDTLNITLVGIAVPRDRHRMLRPDNVDAIAESMKAQGQLQPIVVRERPGRGYWLIAGRHRFEAAKKLKWETIRCEVKEDISADQAELIEIDENLIRAELTPAEMAMHTVRRKELYEIVHPATKHGGDRKSKKSSGQVGHLNERFTKETAKKTGQSERKVRRDAGRGKNVKVLADVVGTCLDQGKELDALAKLPEEEQRALAERAKAGEKVTARTKVEEAADRAEKPPEKPKPDVSRAADRAQARAKVIMLSADELESKLAPIVAGIKAEGKKRIATISISTVARLGELLDRQLHDWLAIVQLDDDLGDDAPGLDADEGMSK